MFLIFLETGEFRRLGSTDSRKADIRIIAATNREMGAAIAEGGFRGDLVARMTFFYRVPALRERRGEIAGIVARFLRANGGRWELTDDGMSRLRDHDWPGNVRELRRVVRYCTCFSKDGTIDLDLVEEGIRHERVVTGQGREGLVAEFPKPKSDEAVKRELAEALESAGGRKSVAARLLGVHRSTVYRRLERLGGPELPG